MNEQVDEEQIFIKDVDLIHRVLNNHRFSMNFLLLGIKDQQDVFQCIAK